MEQSTSPPAPKRLSYFHDALALCNMDFPIYYIECISERHVVVAGGGGSSGFGVHNQINIIELVPSKGSCYADLVTKFRIPEKIPGAVMTAALMSDQGITEIGLLTGGSHPAIYAIKFESTDRRYHVTGYEILEQTNSKSEAKYVKYVPGMMLIGGFDGQLTRWSGKRVTNQVKAHSKEIDEIDVCLPSAHLITLSRSEGRLVIWSLDDFNKIKEYSNKDMSRNAGVNYRARSCKYAYDKTCDHTKTNSQSAYLLVSSNPVASKNQPCMIYKWAVGDPDYQLVDPGRAIAADSISTMTVSLDGRYVGIGTMTGGVSVFEVKNLKQIYKIDASHYQAVTGLAFLPPKQESQTLTNCNMCPLLSVSMDNRVVLHRPTSKSLTYSMIKTILMIIVIFALFFTLSSRYNIKSGI